MYKHVQFWYVLSVVHVQFLYVLSVPVVYVQYVHVSMYVIAYIICTSIIKQEYMMTQCTITYHLQYFYTTLLYL